ncbi:MAG: type II toxin-antitoxin system Phd/YefM family antitoxin [Christensenellaceae bacterium]|jgi:PHD/YefM family antitoxin component YafN of YafNO toxin-antitoxin module|nr:type II toxin-antitoxin system Phd/YefM family antitoxin [Christensenellaceae bacterium]
MTTVNVTNFRNNLFSYLEQALKFGETLNVATRNGNIIVLTEDDYRGMVETLAIQSNPKLHKDILESMHAPKSEFVELDWESLLTDWFIA